MSFFNFFFHKLLIPEQYFNRRITKCTSFYSCQSVLVPSIFSICDHINFDNRDTGIAYTRQGYCKKKLLFMVQLSLWYVFLVIGKWHSSKTSQSLSKSFMYLQRASRDASPSIRIFNLKPCQRNSQHTKLSNLDEMEIYIFMLF